MRKTFTQFPEPRNYFPTAMNYITIPHVNSNNSRRRGLLVRKNAVTGKIERCNHTTIQVIADIHNYDPHSSPLPHSPLLLRRNKYVPHVGKKQMAKSALI